MRSRYQSSRERKDESKDEMLMRLDHEDALALMSFNDCLRKHKTQLEWYLPFVEQVEIGRNALLSYRK